MPGAPDLSVNIDHVATLRQARRAVYPDPVEAAAVAEEAGATGITVHLRGDRRHVQEQDVRRLRTRVRGKFNLEMAPSDEMLGIATELRPHQVTLVPERPREVTTEGGLDLIGGLDTTRQAAELLREAGIAVSIFLDPSLDQLEALAQLGPVLVSGFEINTDAYTRADEGAAEAEVARVTEVVSAGAEKGFRVYAGHGLTSSNVGAIAAVPKIEELNIGHWIVSRSVIVGMREAVEEMLTAIRAARS